MKIINKCSWDLCDMEVNAAIRAEDELTRELDSSKSFRHSYTRNYL